MKNITKICFITALVMGGVQSACASRTITDIGDFISFKILPVYSVATTFYNSDWNKWYDYDWQGLKQLMVVNLVKSTVTDGLKDRIDETRPSGHGDDSFPSGHTSNAFAHAAFIHRRYGINQAILPYAMASFVGYSRVQARAHYVHDVLAGAAVGFLSAWIFADPKYNVVMSAGTDGARVDFHTSF